jgi:DNA-binding NtrC family response regulator
MAPPGLTIDKAAESLCETAAVDPLIGEDPAFLSLKRKLPHLAKQESPVLLVGETGTGKELCARTLHYLSPRFDKPFLPVNCGAIPLELFESELFGHQKGAFTGAWAVQHGLIEEAEGGTLFLDEIESLSLKAQVKLLRFFEDGTYHSLGSPRLRRADVRIIAATNQDLTQKIREARFRADLYYRLTVLSLVLPPLRHRRVDIPLLVAHFWSQYKGGDKTRLSARAMEALSGYAWPGNVRELQNVIRQLVVLTDGRTIEPEDLPISLSALRSEFSSLSLKQAKAMLVTRFEKSYVTQLLRANHGNVTHAAMEAKMERRAFGRLIKKYHLEKF